MPTYYAIRWDVGWYDDTSASVAERNTLAQPEFHGRAPFFASQTDGGNSLSFVSDQATMDQEIAFANAAGITGWAFLRYANISSPILGGNALARYVASTAKGSLKYCSMEQNGTLGSILSYSSHVPRLVTEMQQSFYGTVTVAAVARKIVYYLYDPGTLAANYTNLAGLKTVLDYLRSQAIAAGLADPYIVLLHFDTDLANSGNVSAVATALGADAIGHYLPFRPYTYDGTYAQVRTAALAYWEQQKAAAIAGSHGLVPTAITGWSPAPRLQRPVPWEAATGQRSWSGHRKVFAFPTDVELAAHMGEAKAFLAANAAVCEADTALIYAWNEHGEGGRVLCPSRDNPTGTWLDNVAGAL